MKGINIKPLHSDVLCKRLPRSVRDEILPPIIEVTGRPWFSTWVDTPVNVPHCVTVCVLEQRIVVELELAHQMGGSCCLHDDDIIL